MVNSKEPEVKTVTVAELAAELDLEADELGVLLERMGMRGGVTAEKVVPATIATNARKAAQKAVSLKALPGGKSGELEAVDVENRKLKQSEVKEIAKDLGLTQTVVKELDRMLHDRACQIAFLEGFQVQKRKDQELTAFESGGLIAELQSIQAKDKRLQEREDRLVDEGTRDFNPTTIAKMVGLDLESILEKVRENTDKQAEVELEHQKQVESDTGLKDAANPFAWLAARKKLAK